ncbi:MAG: hypothetical protein FJ098_07455, partial [Deltaproteobacteria bacterium]|nr:hypothetical protein [Deltaproteobacteria bacterium]
MRATRIACAILALAVALTACRGEEPKGEGPPTAEKKDQVRQDGPVPEAPTAPTEVPAEPAAAPAVRPVLLDDGGLEMIPGSALLVAAVPGIGSLAERVGWAELRTIRRDWYEMAVAAVVQFVGQNILDFANLPEIGVDPTAPMGFAWLSLEDEAFAAWIRLTDPEKFKVTLYKLVALAKDELRPETMGDALILSFRQEDGIKIVLRGDYAILVAADQGEEAAFAHARRVASIDRAGSVVEVPRFKALMDALGSGRDGALYMDVGPALDEALGDEEARRAPEEKPWAETELDQAKARGADAEEIARLTKQAEDDRAWQEKWRKRQQAERELARSLWGSLGTMALGAEIRGRSVTVHSVAAVEGGMILELFGPSEGPPLITKVVSGKPWLLAGATVDVASYRSLFGQLLAIDGGSWDEVEADAREHLGVDLTAEVLALLDGRVGLYGGGTFKPRGDPPEAFAALEGGLYLGVKDPAKATALMERIAARPEVAKLVTAGDGAWRIEVPEWRTVHVKVAGGCIVAASDPAFIDRVAAGGGGDWPGSMGNEDLTALFADSRANAAWMMDLGLLGYMTFARYAGVMDRHIEAEAPGAEEAPCSAESTAKKQAIEEAEKAVVEAERKLEDEELVALQGLFGALGVTAAV